MLNLPVHRVALLAGQNNGVGPLVDMLGRAGLACLRGSDLSELDGDGPEQQPEAALVDLASIDQAHGRQLIEQCKDRRIPVLVLAPLDSESEYDPSLNPDELVFYPVREGELLPRLQQAVYRVRGPASSQLLRAGDLTIDLERYDVMVAGRRVSLKYKEFQLLVLLASNPGRVYSRESLLSQVWEYDYLGGTRTVDVHVRRLRSKIESPGRTFIETIYQVGYRFRAPD